VRDRADSRVALATTLWPRPGYPFHLDVDVEYALADDGLHVSVTARNVGDRPAPYGVGQHPYLTVGAAHVDRVRLTVPARTWLRTDDRGLPVETGPVEGTPFDFRSPQLLGARRLDTAYGDLLRDRTGRCVVALEDPATGRSVDVWLGEGAEWVQVFSGDTVTDPARRRQSLAVEPMSCPPDAFRTGQGLVSLDPGASHTLRWGLVAHG
jgi:aldose 1-epimerase